MIIRDKVNQMIISNNVESERMNKLSSQNAFNSFSSDFIGIS